MTEKINEIREKLPWISHYPKSLSWYEDIPAHPLYKILDDAIQRFPSHYCMNFLGKKFTYHEMGILVNQTAKGLQNLGVKKGTHVGLLMPNVPYYVLFYFAILKLGATIVNFNPLYVSAEIQAQIKDSAIELMVTLDLEALFPKVYEHLNTFSLRKIIICPLKKILPFPKNILFTFFKSKEKASLPENCDLILYDDLIQNKGDFVPSLIDPERDVAVIQYTGGTTGVPKGAMLSHKNLYSNVYQSAYWFSPLLNEGKEKVLAAIPFFHVFAMTAVMNLSFKVGGEIIFIFPRFEVKEGLKLIKKHKITCLLGVPGLYSWINTCSRPHMFNLKSLKVCISGGAPLSLSIKNEFEKLTGAMLVEGYGLSETSPVITVNPLEGVNKPGSAGIPVPQTVVKIMSLDNKMIEVPPGEIGQLAIKGPQVMLGYWNHEQETSNSVIGDFFYTGDIGYIDNEGYIFIVDRLKDMIIVNGYNVYSRTIEDAIYLHPAVEEVTVIGIPDEQRGEMVKAFIKRKEGTVLDEVELNFFLQDKLSKNELPKQIEFRDKLPKTLIGKLSKKELVLEEKLKTSKTTLK